MSLFSIFKKGKKINGFSLVELLVVLAITGVLIMVTGFYYFGYRKNVKLKEAAAIFVQDIKLARQKASAENIRYKFAFNRTNDKVYYVGQYDGANITNSFTKDLKKVSTDISFKTVSSDLSDNGFILEPRGLSTQGYVVLQNGKKKIKVDITATGRVNVINNYTE